MVREAVASSEVEVHQRLPERGRGRCNEVDTGVSNMGAVTQVQGTELRSMAQEEPQRGISELQACQAKFCHSLQSASAFSLPWFGVWWRQQQLTKLGVFHIFYPAEVQEPQCRQWGGAQGRDGEPGAPGKHQLLQALQSVQKPHELLFGDTCPAEVQSTWLAANHSTKHGWGQRLPPA